MTDYELYCGDCLTVLPTLEAQSVDAILTDLPYGTTACKWDSVIPFAPMWAQVKRVLKPRGVFVTTASQPFTSALVMSNLEWFRYEWIWEKERPVNLFFVKKQVAKVHENILVFYKHQPTYNPQMEKSCGVNRKVQGGNESKTHLKQRYNSADDYDWRVRYPRSVQKFHRDLGPENHPTQKPVALYEYLILTYTNEGDTVLDFAGGSGTTCVAAARTGRHCIYVDSSPDYFAIAERRISEAYAQQRLPLEAVNA